MIQPAKNSTISQTAPVQAALFAGKSAVSVATILDFRQQALWFHYQSLDPLEQVVIWIFALRGRQIPQLEALDKAAELAIMLDRTHNCFPLVKTLAISNLKTQVFKPVIDRCLKLSLLVSPTGRGASIDDSIDQIIVRDMLVRGLYTQIISLFGLSRTGDRRSFDRYRFSDADLRIRLAWYVGDGAAIERSLAALELPTIKKDRQEKITATFAPLLEQGWDFEWISGIPFCHWAPQLLLRVRKACWELEDLDKIRSAIKYALTLRFEDQHLEFLQLILRMLNSAQLADHQIPTSVALKSADSVRNSALLKEIEGIEAFYRGEDLLAIACFKSSTSLYKKAADFGGFWPPAFSTVLHLLALIRSKQYDAAEKFAKEVNKFSSGIYWEAMAYIHFHTAGIGVTRPDFSLRDLSSPIGILIAISLRTSSLSATTSYPAQVHISKAEKSRFAKLLQEFIKKGVLKSTPFWLHECYSLLQELAPEETVKAPPAIQKLAEREKWVALRGANNQTAVVEPWMNTLDLLRSAVGKPPTGGTHNQAEKYKPNLLWTLYKISDEVGFSVNVLESRPLKSGKPGPLKSVSMARLEELLESKKIAVDPTDISPLRLLYRLEKKGARYGETMIRSRLESEDLVRALLNNPRIGLATDPSQPVAVVAQKPLFTISKINEQEAKISLYPPLPPLATRFQVIVSEDEQRHVIFNFPPATVEIARALESTSVFPTNSLGEFEEILAEVADKFDIFSDFSVSGQQVTPADPRLRIRLFQDGLGIKGSVYVKPSENSSLFRPGSGTPFAISKVEGEIRKYQRNLEHERTDLEVLTARLSSLQATIPGVPAFQLLNEYEFQVAHPQNALEILSALKEEQEQNNCVLEWPAGEKFRLISTKLPPRIFITASKRKDYFDIGGDVPVDEGQMLSLSQILQKLSKTTGRFVELADGSYLEIKDKLAKQLRLLGKIADVSEDSVRVRPLFLNSMDELLLPAEVSGDATWHSIDQIKQETISFKPAIPEWFTAELREYQKVGFEWLVRLSKLGLGACLADDMGLGKTVQILALLSYLAAEGPALVVAPTSVCFNWEREIKKFAPRLKIKILGPAIEERRTLLHSLSPFDVVICSYGLLQREESSELLSSVSWRTVVLDEAQAIKNNLTNRTQAAFKLQAGFRIAATGTPVENQVGELWSIFNFIVPGLLGTLKDFHSNFGAVSSDDKALAATTLHSLQTLISPYILRRTKKEVLPDLPSRTEIQIDVEFDLREREAYELLRRKTVSALKSAEEEDGVLSPLHVLAALTKLRRACCHPRLINRKLNLPSAKMESLNLLLDELRENNHKALIFSQFVDYLAIVQENLESRGIAYQYLDGSTPMSERAKRVAAFQDEGAGDVFLMSLKAGGVGLNLTAADYVIILDPWWNPAVEDQAADRAHRLGQTKPVTIYRLVVKQSIEEAIVELHSEKRELSDRLLAGADLAGSLTPEQLVRLIGC